MSATVLTKEISRAPVLLGILVRREQIECRHDLAANRGNRVVRNDENKIIAANVANESFFAACSLDDVVQQFSQDPDHAVAFVVAIAVVEFLEVIKIRVTDGEIITACQ